MRLEPQFWEARLLPGTGLHPSGHWFDPDAVVAGETFVVTRNGEPVAELRPIQAGRRTFISPEEVAALGTGGLRIDRHQFRADLDQFIDPDV